MVKISKVAGLNLSLILMRELQILSIIVQCKKLVDPSIANTELIACHTSQLAKLTGSVHCASVHCASVHICVHVH